ncbi:MAG: esterase-like activity of phytase family protein [Cypionkella sp.]
MRSDLSKLLCTVAVVLSAGAASAEPRLIAVGSLTASSAGEGIDLSGLTGTLENGLPKAMLGGIGSGLAYAGNGTFLGLPDRGPNATPFNPKVDDTVSFIPRFDSLTLALTPATAGSALPFEMKAELTGTTLLWSSDALVYGTGEGLNIGSGVPSENTEGHNYFTGRSDAIDPAKSSCNPLNGRVDAEAIRTSADGAHVYVSDEYGPYLYEFDRATGARTRAIALPENLCITKLSSMKDDEIKGNTVGRVTNKGMEGLAITPDGKMLVGVMQAALEQDAAEKASKKVIRIVTIDLASGQTHQYGYKLTDGSGVSEIVAINNHEFLLDERDGAGLGDGSAAEVKKLFRVDLAGAVDITDLAGAAVTEAVVAKTEVLDLVAVLGANGIAADKVPSKIEGLAFGEDVSLDGTVLHTLYIANDNDFLPETSGANLFYVVGFSDADLPGFAAK